MRLPRISPVAPAAVVGLLLFAFAPARATPIPRRFFAISPVHVTDFPPLPMGTIAHPGFCWPVIETQRDSFDFSKYDFYVAEAVARGMIDPATNTAHMAITLGLTPSWAVADQSTCQNHGGQCSAPPDNIVDWKNFLLALIHHYDGVQQPHIHYYELWNEADDSLWFTPTSGDSFSQMVQLAVAADSIIHLDPHSLLLTPSVTGNHTSMVTWMSDYLRAGGAAHADGGAFHGYIGGGNQKVFPFPESDATQGSIITKVTEMRAVFDGCGLAGKPMFQTEGSWGNFNETVPDTMAAWLARFELLQAGLRAANDLQMAAWFAWADSAFGWGNLETRAGTPNQAGIAYEQVYAWVVGATMDSACTENSNGTWTCTMTRPGGYLGHAVWNVNGTTSYTPGSAFTRYRDLAGNTVAIGSGASVNIGPKPILFESGVVTNGVAGLPRVPFPLRALPSVTRGPTRIVFGAGAAPRSRLTIRDVQGRRIRAFDLAAGSGFVTWDGTDARGRAVASGMYFIRYEGPGAGGTTRVSVVR